MRCPFSPHEFDPRDRVFHLYARHAGRRSYIRLQVIFSFLSGIKLQRHSVCEAASNISQSPVSFDPTRLVLNGFYPRLLPTVKENQFRLSRQCTKPDAMKRIRREGRESYARASWSTDQFPTQPSLIASVITGRIRFVRGFQPRIETSISPESPHRAKHLRNEPAADFIPHQ